MTRAYNTATTQQNTGGPVNPFVAGKNKIINGDFRINQRAFTSVTANLSFGFDRWFITTSGGTTTYTPQTFTAGAAPVAGYEAINFARLVTSGHSGVSDRGSLIQRIEDVRTFAGETVTVSFWAKASTGTPSVSAEFLQSFGTGGSASASAGVSKTAITSSWARYTATIAVPSISGKTIGDGSSLTLVMWTSAGSDFNSRSSSLGIQNVTIDFWGVQVEAGSVATAFQTATGTIQGELAACQRYYYRIADSSQNYTAITVMHDTSLNGTTTGNTIVSHPVPMRTAPISTEFSNIGFHRYDGTLYSITAVTIDTATDSIYGALYGLTISGSPTPAVGNVGRVIGNNNSGAYFGVSAEL